MKKFLVSTILGLTLCTGAFAQNWHGEYHPDRSERHIERIYIKHVDPIYMLKMLKCEFILKPEFSTLFIYFR